MCNSYKAHTHFPLEIIKISSLWDSVTCDTATCRTVLHVTPTHASVSLQQVNKTKYTTRHSRVQTVYLVIK